LIASSLALAWIVSRLAEPARGGQSQLQPGAQTLDDTSGDTEGTGQPGENIAIQAARREQIEPHRELVLHSDPSRRPLWWAIRYVLRVRTNVVLIIASALGYFYFYGMDSFATNFTMARYGVGKAEAAFLVLVVGAGTLAGVYTGGRLTDRLLRRGHVRARIAVPMVCLLVISAFFGPAFATTSVAIALPLLIAGAFLLGAPQPPIDAARLDIMPAQLWGRAEGVRTALRSLADAAAPALFGYMSQYVFGGPASSAAGSGPGSGRSGAGRMLSPAGATALAHTFLVFLVLLVIAGLLALFALRTYPRDLATAAASAQDIRAGGRAVRPPP
ncbi:MAG: MFS transporter, partial [Streptosporangiaceae bacterium]|nr:MFS transporter [Streptosporangiaceae bacterium]